MFKICLCSHGTQDSVIQSSKFELNLTQTTVTDKKDTGIASKRIRYVLKDVLLISVVAILVKPAFHMFLKFQKVLENGLKR